MRFRNRVNILVCFLVLLYTCAYAVVPLPSPVKNLNHGEQQVAPQRGLLLGGDHGTGDIHHDNIYVSLNGGPIVYQTTVPARKTGNLLPDKGVLSHLFTPSAKTDNPEITIYATSALVCGVESRLSNPLPLSFEYTVPETCTEQTVPVAFVGDDQLVSVGDTVTLDGSLSHDLFPEDNANLVYRWECYSAPEASVLMSDEGKASVITFTPNRPGNYYFRFTVRDKIGDDTFNRSPISYVRVSAVQGLGSQAYISANAGRTQQVQVGYTVTLDGSFSQGTSTIARYSWTQENPLDIRDVQEMSNIMGQAGFQGQYHVSNFDADTDVDGSDLAILAANYSGIDLLEQPVVQFTAGIARPHIFRLTVEEGGLTDSETTIVAVNHGNANQILMHPVVETGCFE